MLLTTECRHLWALAKNFWRIAFTALMLIGASTLSSALALAQESDENPDDSADYETYAETSASGECDPYGVLVATTPIPPQQPARLKLYYEQMRNVPSAADIVVVGDSQAARFSDAYAEAAFPGKHVFNLGVGGDRTQTTLWRLRHDELGALSPSMVVLLSGGPNLSDTPACAIAVGIVSIVDRVHELWPDAQIVKVDITPRGKDFRQKDDVRLAANRQVRDSTAGYAFVHTLDLDDALTCGYYSKPPAYDYILRSLGWRIRCENFLPDNLHWTAGGYDILAAAINESLGGVSD